MIVEYEPGGGILHRAHPFTNLALMGSAILLAFLLPVPSGPLILAAALVALALVAKVARVLVTAAVVAIPIWAFLLLIHGVLGEDLPRAFALGGRISSMLLSFLMLLVTIPPGKLLDALVERRVPFSFAYLLAATLQAVPRLRARARQILDAQRCRGLRVRGSLGRRIGAIVPLAVPLVLGALTEVEERALALETRGGGRDARRTALDPPTDSPTDRLIRWSLAIGMLVAVLLRAVG